MLEHQLRSVGLVLGTRFPCYYQSCLFLTWFDIFCGHPILDFCEQLSLVTKFNERRYYFIKNDKPCNTHYYNLCRKPLDSQYQKMLELNMKPSRFECDLCAFCVYWYILWLIHKDYKRYHVYLWDLKIWFYLCSQNMWVNHPDW